jgi:phytanoyl-CoA hydroxylase
MTELFSQEEIAAFNRDGFLIVPGLTDSARCDAMVELVQASLDPPLAPLEFETDVQYPGSPVDRLSPGGDTPRRLLNAYTRDRLFREWATSPGVCGRVRRLMGAERVLVSQNHHNCIMTKHPGYSSATLWHQDIRYWLFDRPELISVWLALGDENPENGGMQMIPGTHTMDFDRGRFDAATFFRTDLEENQALIDSAVSAQLRPGDVMFFHCRTLHAAGRNTTDQVKLSLVFTYHDETNQPIAGSRSAAFPDIACNGA